MYVCTYLGVLELVGIIHIVNGDLAVGQEVVALDLSGQQKVICILREIHELLYYILTTSVQCGLLLCVTH